tara:strand:- start:2240 stop:2575 length:336 start_codon:yes stop_codon:yes gene_type:complete
MTILDNPIVQFIIGGTILSGGTYLANFSNPFLASLLVSFPLELITLFLIQKKNRRREFIFSWITILIGAFTGACILYLLIPIKTIGHTLKIILGFIIWISIASITYFFTNR